MIAALYVDRERGPYANIEGVDCWDEQRDARLYRGPHPIVAHPPCCGWGQMRMSRMHLFEKNNWPTERYDRAARLMQCGPIAVRQVRQYGGVLEHPENSYLWSYCNMPKPGCFPDEFGGWTIAFDQGEYGHPCPKRSWLYVVGYPVDGVRLRTARSAATGRVESQWSSKRHITPIELADELVSIARGVQMPRGVGA